MKTLHNLNKTPHLLPPHIQSLIAGIKTSHPRFELRLRVSQQDSASTMFTMFFGSPGDWTLLPHADWDYYQTEFLEKSQFNMDMIEYLEFI